VTARLRRVICQTRCNAKPASSPPRYLPSRLLISVNWSVNWFACLQRSTCTFCRTPPSSDSHANPILWIEANTQGEVTSQNLWSRYDRHVVGITWHGVWSQKPKIYGVIRIKLNQLVYENDHATTSLPVKRIKALL